MDLKTNQIDLTKADEGVWHYFDDETRFRICRYGNKNYRRAYRNILSPYKTKQRMHALTIKQSQDFENQVLSRTILVDWDNLKENGKIIEYSTEKAYEIFSDPRYDHIAAFVREVAEVDANYRQEELAEAVEK